MYTHNKHVFKKNMGVLSTIQFIVWGFCPRGFRPWGFYPRGFCPGGCPYPADVTRLIIWGFTSF